ncbi:hypothetical protein BS50DRAFT_641508 [Corynespora cassiicola Philippines]|uniref:Uncharacterized protein n=1 Tax=Corynespora cassiicola Philippines TaxID=1448308 RepID=A0A2T2N127_CORCC|nr:hypothetical protein BS50DRAFT_641508 [Corynespora cassiicola Philippines]
MVDYDNLIFGKAIESSGGSDGIVKGDPRFNTAVTEMESASAAKDASSAYTWCLVARSTWYMETVDRDHYQATTAGVIKVYP